MKMKYFTLALASVMFLTATENSKQANYDGRWWLSIDKRHRAGFVYGFVVCYHNLVDRNRAFAEPVSVYTTRLTEYLQAHPESLPVRVETIFLKIAGPPSAKPIHRPSGSNETPQELASKWGAKNNGDEWRGPGTWQLGYVEGFLECYTKHTKSEYGSFSKPREWYVNAIAKWYGTKEDDPEEINVSRENEKIPEVLFRFRDKK